MKSLLAMLVAGGCMFAVDGRIAFAVGNSADFNGDHNVDHHDLARWNENYGVGAGADADANGLSDGADFLSWQRQLGSADGSNAGMANPEPATLVVWSTLAAVAGVGLAVRRRREREAANGTTVLS